MAVVVVAAVWLVVFPVGRLDDARLLGPPVSGYDASGRSPAPKFVQMPEGRHKLWARGPRDLEQGTWFDVTNSPLDPAGYEHGIGQDTIRAIDRPQFVPASDSQQLAERGITDRIPVIGYHHQGQAKAYPLPILDRHELVNDTVGGKPVTVGW